MHDIASHAVPVIPAGRAGEVVALPPHVAVFADVRGEGRTLRVSHHEALGCIVLSSWRDGVCVSTVRLRLDEVGDLVQALVAGTSDVVTLDRTEPV